MPISAILDQALAMANQNSGVFIRFEWYGSCFGGTYSSVFFGLGLILAPQFTNTYGLYCIRCCVSDLNWVLFVVVCVIWVTFWRDCTVSVCFAWF